MEEEEEDVAVVATEDGLLAPEAAVTAAVGPLAATFEKKAGRDPAAGSAWPLPPPPTAVEFVGRWQMTQSVLEKY